VSASDHDDCQASEQVWIVTAAMSAESMHTGFGMRQQAESDLEAKPCCDADSPLDDLAFVWFP